MLYLVYLLNLGLKVYKLKKYLFKIIVIIEFFFKVILNHLLFQSLRNINLNNVLYLSDIILNIK